MYSKNGRPVAYPTGMHQQYRIVPCYKDTIMKSLKLYGSILPIIIFQYPW